MPWGAEYQTPAELDEQRAQQDAALEAQQRAKLSQFERRVVDALTDIAGSLKTIADNTTPLYELDAQTGDIKVHHGVQSVVHDAANKLAHSLRRASETNTAAGDGGGVSAGPVSPPPGPARPDTNPENPS